MLLTYKVYNQPSAFLEYVRTMKRVDIQIDDVIAFFISLVHQSSTTTDVQNHQQMIDYRSDLIDAVESLGDIDWTPASSRLPKRSGGGVVSDHEPTSAYSLDNSDGTHLPVSSLLLLTDIRNLIPHRGP